MKRLLLILTLLCLTQISFSQNRWGIRAGLNIANQKLSAGNWSQKESPIASFHLGAVGDIRLSNLIYLQPSFLLSGKGSDNDGVEDGNGNHVTVKYRPYYLEIPLNVVLKTNFPNSDVVVFGGAGPSLGVGLFGNVEGVQATEDVFKNTFKRLDFGINLTTGVEIPSGWQFSFHYTPGVANIYGGPDVGADLKWKNKVIGLSVGYFFGGKK